MGILIKKASDVSLEEELSDIEADIIKRKKELEIEISDFNLLESGITTKYRPNTVFTGKIEDDIWAVKEELFQAYTYLDFSCLKEDRFKFLGVKSRHIEIMKLWVLERLVEFRVETDDDEYVYTAKGSRSAISVVVDFLEKTSFLQEEFLEDSKGCELTSYIEELEGIYRTKQVKVEWILDFLEQFILYSTTEESDRISLYIAKLTQKDIELRSVAEPSKPRKLPNGRDIVSFSCYIDIFLNDPSVNDELKLIFMPIILWWKVSVCLPLRPSEFIRKIPRDATFEKDGLYYLRIDRVKKRNTTKKALPVLREIIITKEIYDLINKYVADTEKYGDADSLLSYRALNELKRATQNKFNLKPSEQKYFESSFTHAVLQNLLKQFYDVVITGIYKDTFIDKRVRLGDARHIAFTSMILQGFSPIEIAIIGGHQSLRSSDNYTSAPEIYIDLQVIGFIRKPLEFNVGDTSKLEDIVFNMPEVCPVDVKLCPEAIFGDDEVEIGHCTAYQDTEIYTCKSEGCEKCPKWWCYPSNDNFRKLELVKKDEIKNKKNRLSADLAFTRDLLKKVGLDFSGDSLELDEELAKVLKRVSLNLDSNTKDITFLEYELISKDDDKYKLISAIDELLPYKEVDKVIKEFSKKEKDNG